MKTMFRQGTDIEFNRKSRIGIVLASSSPDAIGDLDYLANNHVPRHFYDAKIDLFVTREAMNKECEQAVVRFMTACQQYHVRMNLHMTIFDPRELPVAQLWIDDVRELLLSSVATLQQDASEPRYSLTKAPSVTYANDHDFIASVLDPQFDQLIVLGDRDLVGEDTPVITLRNRPGNGRSLLRRLYDYDFMAAYRWS